MKIICLSEVNNTLLNNDQIISLTNYTSSKLLHGFTNKGCMKHQNKPFLTASGINLLWTRAVQF